MSRDATLHASILAYHSDHTTLATLIRDNLTERTGAQSLAVSTMTTHYRDLIIRNADALKQNFKGEVVAITSQHTLVQVSDMLAVSYEKNKLDRDVHIGEKLAIHYKDQKSQVYEQGKEPACKQGLERDRER